MERKFIEYFSGLQRNYGFADLSEMMIDPQTGKNQPKKYGWTHRQITDQDYIDHLNGKKSIGIQPCNDEGMARFGAIDIDSKDYKDFSVKKYLDIIKSYDLPLIPVKSKSGGLHLYLFLKEPVKTLIIKKFLESLLFTLKLPLRTEIYPKQTELGKDSEGKFIDGNFINLPYYNKAERISINFDGKEFTFEQFIKVIEANLKTASELEEFSLAHVKTVLQGGPSEFDDGPPCLQMMTKNPLDDGRDRWLYNYMVFAKKRYQDKWEEMVIDAPKKYFLKDSNGLVVDDWGEKKVRDKIRSWKKDSTKGYTCTQEPIVNFCMKSECVKRKYGFLSDRKILFPKLSSLVKIKYPEPEYTFNVELPSGESKSVKAKNIKQIVLQEEIRSIIAAAADFVPPKVKSNEFQEVLDSLFPPKEELLPPKGTTPDEQLEEYLRDFVNGPQAKSNASFKSGAVLVEGDHVYFKYQSFYNTLKNKDWREDKSKTAEKIIHIGGGKLKTKINVPKRFPKKPGEKESHDPIDVIQMPMEKFKIKSIKPEVIPVKSKKDIF
jgi:hypothetical protein